MSKYLRSNKVKAFGVIVLVIASLYVGSVLFSIQVSGEYWDLEVGLHRGIVTGSSGLVADYTIPKYYDAGTYQPTNGATGGASSADTNGGGASPPVGSPGYRVMDILAPPTGTTLSLDPDWTEYLSQVTIPGSDPNKWQIGNGDDPRVNFELTQLWHTDMYGTTTPVSQAASSWDDEAGIHRELHYFMFEARVMTQSQLAMPPVHSGGILDPWFPPYEFKQVSVTMQIEIVMKQKQSGAGYITYFGDAKIFSVTGETFPTPAPALYTSPTMNHPYEVYSSSSSQGEGASLHPLIVDNSTTILELNAVLKPGEQYLPTGVAFKVDVGQKWRVLFSLVMSRPSDIPDRSAQTLGTIGFEQSYPVDVATILGYVLLTGVLIFVAAIVIMVVRRLVPQRHSKGRRKY